jgi:hypothetical protein
MVLNHVWGLLTQPGREWERIREERCTVPKCYFNHVLILAALPAICGFIGTTQVGWRFGAGEPVMLTTQSALLIAVLFYLAMLVGVYIMGRLMHWMALNFGAEPTMDQCVVTAAYIATPLFLVGITALYPVLWINMLAGLVAVGYTVYLLYTGIPIVMRVTKEQGFLFASSLLTVGLVMLVGMLAVTALLWGVGFGPVFTAG